MLPASHRMRSGSDFTTAVRGGRRAGRRTLVVHYRAPEGAATPAEAPARVGFIVSKAVGGSVTRNRVKRRLRHLMQAELGRLAPGSLVVVRANPAGADDGARLASDLTGALGSVLRSTRDQARS
ncbi:ribonuclease P protein component [Spongisporangium articulatum]|uniref:Ribonuclease P protein component n=1 Tax=Spongisporangium articulatum TaxID=3362603 RepID=A0ABW8AI30_9ACTN